MSRTRIRIKNSNVKGKKPLVSDLRSAELAYNTYDGSLYAKRERPGIGTDIVEIGIGVSVQNVLYVTKDGNNLNSGEKLGDSKSSIKSALEIATPGTVVKVSAGNYIENNPIVIPDNVSIIGDGERDVTIIPQNNDNIFYLGDSTTVENISFTGSSNYAIFSFNPDVVKEITKQPLIKNCTNYINTSIGLKLNGNLVSGLLKSVKVESLTQYNQSGVGVSISNGATAYVNNMFTICNDISVYAEGGGICYLNSCNSSYGNYGLVADGVSVGIYTGATPTSYPADSSVFALKSIPVTPYNGLVAYFGSLYYTVTSIKILNGGSGYLSRPTVTISAPSESWGINASAIATITNGSVTSIDIVSPGRGYSSQPTIIISPPNEGINTATAEAIILPTYYSVQSATQTSSGISTVTFNETVPYTIPQDTIIYFFRQSRIVSNSQTFEYIGTGTDLASSLPSNGGIPIQENEILMKNGGLVVFSSIDHSGNIRLGEGFVVDQIAGSVTGDVYTGSIFSNVTPLILALGGGE
jgi:hypothetical protein